MKNVQNISIRGSDLEWLKYPKQMNGGKLDSVGREPGRHRRHKYKKVLSNSDKITLKICRQAKFNFRSVPA
jgi:hypothetical protein